jgi:Family of unknown function (DUF5955)
MREDVSNSGIIQHGGSISAGYMAVGHGATIRLGDVNSLERPDMGEIALRLRQLTEAVTEQRSSIENHPEVGQATSQLAAELRHKEPRWNRVLHSLAVIAQGAGSVASVASAVESLRTAVLAVL